MKLKLGMDIICSSPASTAIGRSEDHSQRSSRSHNAPRHVHQSNDSIGSNITPRLIRVLSTPCSSSSDLALNPKPVTRHEYQQLQKQRIESVMASDEQLTRRRRRSSADVSDVINKALARAGYRCAALAPAGAASTSYDDDQDDKLERRRRSSSRRPPVSRSSGDENDSPNPKSISGYHRSTDKIVVLWVSLHCKGCEAKVRKHISKMEGVTSFSTDWTTKRVTIISNMDPHDVLASVSRVKYAQFWPSSSSSIKKP